MSRVLLSVNESREKEESQGKHLQLRYRSTFAALPWWCLHAWRPHARPPRSNLWLSTSAGVSGNWTPVYLAVRRYREQRTFTSWTKHAVYQPGSAVITLALLGSAGRATFNFLSLPLHQRDWFAAVRCTASTTNYVSTVSGLCTAQPGCTAAVLLYHNIEIEEDIGSPTAVKASLFLAVHPSSFVFRG